MSRALSAFSLSATAVSLYRQVLRSAPARLEDHARELDLDLASAAAELDNLVAQRLVRRTADGLVLGEDPRLALGRLLDREEWMLANRRQDLADARTAIGVFAADYQIGHAGPADGVQPAVETVSAEAAMSLLTAVIRRTHGPVLGSVSDELILPVLDDDLLFAQDLAAGVHHQRTLFAASVLEDPRARAMVDRWAASGAQQRIAGERLTDFVVLGTEMVITRADWGVGTGRSMVIRDPMLVRTFSCLFDHAWAMALPMQGSRQQAPERTLLTLLAAGLKDEAIARHMSSGVRTVRRRVARLMSQLDVETRFQLGAAAERSGLLRLTDSEGVGAAATRYEE
ncbi:MAG TPA: hypothetical protein VFJ97_17630 [Dermatophilaceae bacterium]|nr:hypothetical protein [Dermatophilaceae bacterium]